ncbi:MAG: adenylate kinase [Ruminococcaceae bacterium]|nr:adenylate kinase [Oscillospiraceae bacterium]
MKKVVIIGCPGSGKSTFARALHSKTNIPLFHLDILYWNPDKTTVEKSIFLQRLKNVLDKDEWIIDGNYASTMESRIEHCDTVFFLDFSTDVCLDGLKERRGKPRSDMPWVESDVLDEDFIEFVRSYNTESRPKVLDLLERFNDKNIVVFHSRSEMDEYIEAL